MTGGTSTSGLEADASAGIPSWLTAISRYVGRQRVFQVGPYIVTSVALLLYDVIILSSPNVYHETDITLWGTALSLIVLSAICGVLWGWRSRWLAVIMPPVVISLLALGRLVFFNEGIIRLAYSMLLACFSAGCVFLDGFSDLECHVQRPGTAASREDSPRPTQTILVEARFLLDRLVFSLVSVAAIVGVTMTILWTGETFEATRRDRTLAAGAMLMMLGAGFLQAFIWVVVPLFSVRAKALAFLLTNGQLPSQSVQSEENEEGVGTSIP